MKEFFGIVFAAVVVADLAMLGLWRMHNLPIDWDVLVVSNVGTFGIVLVAAMLTALIS